MNGALGNANPQRVALKETQDLKVRLQACLQLSGANNQENRQKGQTNMFNGLQKPILGDLQSGGKKDTDVGSKANGKQEQLMQRPTQLPAQRTADHQTGSTHGKGGNKENEHQDAAKPKTAKYVDHSSILHRRKIILFAKPN